MRRIGLVLALPPFRQLRRRDPELFRECGQAPLSPFGGVEQFCNHQNISLGRLSIFLDTSLELGKLLINWLIPKTGV